MEKYTLKDLVALKHEYLATLDDCSQDEWFGSHQDIASDELEGFLGWLNVREWTP